MIEFLTAVTLVAVFLLAFEPAHRRILRRGPLSYGADRTRVLAEWRAAAQHVDPDSPAERTTR